MNEQEARELLQNSQVLRDPADVRSCAEIAQVLGLGALSTDEAQPTETPTEQSAWQV